MPDVCIIGGGASAMTAAITAARENPSLKICILEKKEQPGKKLAATGNGKCNMSNEVCAKVRETLQFFDSMGILTRTDEQGRIYPYSQQAKAVVQSMTRQLEALQVEVKTNCCVEEIKHRSDGFEIKYKGGRLLARKVLLATGGKAGPQFGTTGDGYAFAKSLGHHVTKLAPALTGLETIESFKGMKGARVKGMVRLYKRETLIAEEQGEIQFTEDGISGICVFNLSRFIKFAPDGNFKEELANYVPEVDFLSEMEQDQILSFLQQRREIKGLYTEDLLLSVLPDALAGKLLEAAEVSKGDLIENVKDRQLARLAELLKGWRLPLKGIKGWKMAQCTAGGVELSEIHLETMESRLVENLYFSGEIIDFDGPCGGFNLQNAWETGIKAGKAMANV